MKFKHFAAYFIVIVMVLGMTGCSEAVSYEDDLEDEEPLSIYLLSVHSKEKHFIGLYNILKPRENRKIKITDFAVQESKAMYDRLINELSVGKGPDIIYIDCGIHQSIDVYKLAEKNSFADMDILIEKDGEFDFSDYNAIALDGGIINGKRIMMPVSYMVPYILGVEECFDGNHLDIPDKLTMDSYLDLIEAYHQTRPNEPALLGINPIYLLAEYIKVDQPIEKSNELKRLFEVLKEEFSRLERADPVYYNNYISWMEYWPNDPLFGYLGFFIEKNLLFKLTWGLSYFDLFRYYNIIHHHGGNVIIFEQPLVEDGPNKAYVENLLAININSKHKNEAFDFVKFMMSKQTSLDKYRSYHLPISVDGYTHVKKDLLDGYQYYSGVQNSSITDEVQLPQNIVDQIIDYTESAETCEFIGQFQYVYYNILHESIQSYYDDHITFDEMIDQMNNKMAIYLSE